jgi:hypothetical protein
MDVLEKKLEITSSHRIIRRRLHSAFDTDCKRRRNRFRVQAPSQLCGLLCGPYTTPRKERKNARSAGQCETVLSDSLFPASAVPWRRIALGVTVLPKAAGIVFIGKCDEILKLWPVCAMNREIYLFLISKVSQPESAIILHN